MDILPQLGFLAYIRESQKKITSKCINLSKLAVDVLKNRSKDGTLYSGLSKKSNKMTIINKKSLLVLLLYRTLV
ncbi:hypothetical protein J6TS7_20870 [Paenibacillus dendritiformis]|nr:hypothetical protein J6TS7_20870 [Paenibacillus dendritiformis]